MNSQRKVEDTETIMDRSCCTNSVLSYSSPKREAWQPQSILRVAWSRWKSEGYILWSWTTLGSWTNNWHTNLVCTQMPEHAWSRIAANFLDWTQVTRQRYRARLLLILIPWGRSHDAANCKPNTIMHQQNTNTKQARKKTNTKSPAATGGRRRREETRAEACGIQPVN